MPRARVPLSHFSLDQPQHRPQVTCRLSPSPSWNEPLRPRPSAASRTGGKPQDAPPSPPRPYRGRLGQGWKGQGLTQETAAGVGSGTLPRSFPWACPISLGSQCFRLPLTAITQLCDLKTLTSTHPSPEPSPISSMASLPHLLPSSTCTQQLPKSQMANCAAPFLPPTAWPRNPSASFSTPRLGPATLPGHLCLQALAAAVPLATRPFLAEQNPTRAEGPAES